MSATTDTDTVPSAKKSSFPGVDKAALFMFNPGNLAIMGGKDALSEAERGPLDTVTDKEHPLYDERLKSQKLSPDFVANIKANGIRETINIVKIGDVAFVANGRRRVRAARAASTTDAPVLVPCRLVKLDDVGMLREMIITNLHEDDSPTIKIAKLKRLVGMGVTPEDAAQVFATRPATVKAWLQYDATAIPAVKKAVASGKIPQTTGADIARLGDEDKQQKALDKVLATVSDSPDRTERKGSAAKAKRAIAEATGKHAGVSDKKTLRKLIELAPMQCSKGDKAETVAWWRGVADALSFVVGGAEPDARLTKLLADLDSAPAAPPIEVVDFTEEEKTKPGKGKGKGKGKKPAPTPAEGPDDEE